MATRKELLARVRERDEVITANAALMYRQWWRTHRRRRRETKALIDANLRDLDQVERQRWRYGR